MPSSWRRWRDSRREQRRRDELATRARRSHIAVEQSGLDERCAALVGEVLERVVYVEMDYGGEPMWSQWPDFDSVDHGVELRMASGRTFSIFWDCGRGAEWYGLNLAEGGSVPANDEARCIDVTATSRWSSAAGRTVTASRLLWRPVEGASDRKEPQTIRLDFDGERVLVTAFETRDGLIGHSGADHLTVFFGDAWERRSDLTADIHSSLD
jgi:hypothetical protein